MTELTISYTSSAHSSSMTAKALAVLEEVAKAGEVTAFTITSTSRTVDDQARIMLADIRRHGVAYSRKLYGAKCKEIFEAYEKLDKQGSGDGEIKAAFALKIAEIGPQFVSNHITSDTNQLCVFDIGPNSVVPNKNKGDLISALEAHKDVARVLKPPTDKAIHVEVR